MSASLAPYTKKELITAASWRRDNLRISNWKCDIMLVARNQVLGTHCGREGGGLRRVSAVADIHTQRQGPGRTPSLKKKPSPSRAWPLGFMHFLALRLGIWSTRSRPVADAPMAVGSTGSPSVLTARMHTQMGWGGVVCPPLIISALLPLHFKSEILQRNVS